MLGIESLGADMINKDNWKEKFSGLLNTCQDELKKTTEIGKKMFAASKTNSDIKENYEELGVILFKGLEDGSIKLESDKALKLCEQIKAWQKDLESIEADVQAIKKEESEQKSKEANR